MKPDHMTSRSARTERAWGRLSSPPSADPDAWPKVALPTRSKSNDADVELNAQPPLLKARHSAYFDALQQLDEQEDDSGTEQRSTKARTSVPELSRVWSGARAPLGLLRVWSMVRRTTAGTSASREPPRPGSPNATASPTAARRRTTVSGEERRRASDDSTVSALVLHRTGSGEPAGVLEISTEGCERPKAGPESRGARKAPSSPRPSAFAFMAPEPFVQYNSTAHLSSRLLEAAFLLLLGVLTALLAVLIVQVPIAIGQVSDRVQAAALEWLAPYGWAVARLAAYLVYLGISLLCGALALAATLPPLGSRHAVGSGIPEMKVRLNLALTLTLTLTLSPNPNSKPNSSPNPNPNQGDHVRLLAAPLSFAQGALFAVRVVHHVVCYIGVARTGTCTCTLSLLDLHRQDRRLD